MKNIIFASSDDIHAYFASEISKYGYSVCVYVYMYIYIYIYKEMNESKTMKTLKI